MFTDADLASPPASHDARTGGAEQSRAELLRRGPQTPPRGTPGPPFPLPPIPLSAHRRQERANSQLYLQTRRPPWRERRSLSRPGAPKTIRPEYRPTPKPAPKLQDALRPATRGPRGRREEGGSLHNCKKQRQTLAARGEGCALWRTRWPRRGPRNAEPARPSRPLPCAKTREAPAWEPQPHTTGGPARGGGRSGRAEACKEKWGPSSFAAPHFIAPKPPSLQGKGGPQPSKACWAAPMGPVGSE